MNGVIILDKPEGCTSHDMVNKVRRLTGIRRVGHTGTLDPMATGVLPVCVGNATKAADMLTFSDKAYRASFVLGKTTDTQDAEGTVLSEKDVCCTEEEIRAAIGGFVGETDQIPPMYSAVKQNGKKLYELARKGIEVERKSRRINIYSIDILEIKGNIITIDVSCSKGTYIRTLCADIGDKLGTGAYPASLRRTKTGILTEKDCITVEALEKLSDRGAVSEALMPVDALFSYMPQIILNDKQVNSVTNGIRMTYNGKENQSYRVYGNDGKFLCISKLIGGRLVLEKSFWS